MILIIVSIEFNQLAKEVLLQVPVSSCLPFRLVLFYSPFRPVTCLELLLLSKHSSCSFPETYECVLDSNKGAV